MIRFTSSNTRKEVLDLLGRTHRAALPYFENRYRFDPYTKREGLMLYHDDDVLVGTAQLLIRNAFWRGRKIKVAGIANVSTLPRRQGQGIASRMMTECESFARRRGCDLMLLFTDLYGFYRKLGFRKHRICCFRVPLPPCKKSPESVRVIAPREIAIVRKIYQQGIWQTRFGFERTSAFWSGFLRWLPGVDILGFWSAGELRAYAVVRSAAGEPEVLEYYSRGTDSVGWQDIVTYLAVRFRYRKMITYFMPPGKKQNENRTVLRDLMYNVLESSSFMVDGKLSAAKNFEQQALLFSPVDGF